MQNVDVLIVGGGIIGMTLAYGLQGSGLRILVLEKHIQKSLSTDKFSAIRVSVINLASEKLLRHLGIWSNITASRSACLHGVEVWDRDGFGHITFNDFSFGYSHLAHVIENATIHAALWQKNQQCVDVKLVSPAQLQEVVWRENEVFITLENGPILTAKLIVGADGANSWLRNKAKIPFSFWDYHHHALVATISTTEPHGNIARQIFHSDGILALLPLNDPYLCSIVWSLEPNRARQIREAKREAFNQELCITCDSCLGLCSLESECQTFPLTGLYAHRFAAHRLALIGDAAHTIHPLAGQGINLGLMDAAKLIEELLRLHYAKKDIGQYPYLRRYERNRKYSAAIMLAGMQGFREFFSGTNPVKKLLRNISIKIANTLPWIKSQLLLQATGLNDLPDWLR